MHIGINCGHTLSGPGAGAMGYFSESEHTRHVGRALMEKFRAAGVQVTDCTIDKAASQQDYLEKAVGLANNQELDWFISIHFNASNQQGYGTEVYTYEGRQYPDALAVCQNLSALGFRNRGVKKGTGLYVIRKSKAKSMLIEVCFCDNLADTKLYVEVTLARVVDAVFDALYDYTVAPAAGGEMPVMGESVATEEQLNAWLLAHNPQAGGYTHLAGIFLDEGKKEGVRGDVAFCQMCIETGYLKFGGDVRPEQHNYCGLGATGGVRGLEFLDDRTGIRAQVQHLKGYASCLPLIQACVDPRYHYINPKGKAPTVERLSGKWAVPGYSGYKSFADAWAAQDTYGHHIARMVKQLTDTR